MKVCLDVYNKAIRFLNTNQSFDSLGKAKGTKEQQFKTLSMRTWIKALNLDIPAKLIHSTLMRAYKAWSKTRKERGSKDKFAKYLTTKEFTLETDPLALKKGKLYPKFWGNLEPLIFRYKHRCHSILTGTTLIIYQKYGRFYCSQPHSVKFKSDNKSDKIIALDPGLRTFITGFDGHVLYQFSSEEDLQRIAKLKAYHAKLHKKLKGKSLEHKRKIKFKMTRLNRKVINLVAEMHRKIAHFLATNFRVIFLPKYRVKKIFAKDRQNKTNRKNQLNLSWYKFTKLLEYNCAKYGSGVIQVSEAYTSRTCSNCGYVHHKLGSNKTFICPECNHSLGRDFNGAINIWMNSLILQSHSLVN